MATEISRGRKYTTIEELEQSEKGPVWVLNNTRDALEGKVVVSIAKKNGNGSDVIRIPRSFIPFDLTLQVTRSQLLDSSDFRQTIGKKFLRLITPEYAAVLLSTEEAKEEQVRLRNDEQKAKMALKKAGIVEETNSGVGEDDDEEFFEISTEKGKVAAKKKSEQKAKVKEDTSKRSPSIKVQNLVAAASRDEKTDTQILADIKRLGSSLKRVDLAFLSKQYEDKPKIIAYLKKVLAAKKKAVAAA
jgi:hypothetical protein